MKLILLMYLEEDDSTVMRLLEEVEVRAFSRLDVEGRGRGEAGWLGTVAPFDSRLVFAVVSDDQAVRVLEAVEGLESVQDERHPVHAVQLDVDACVCSGGARPPFLTDR